MRPGNDIEDGLEDVPWPGSLPEMLRSLFWTAVFSAAIGVLIWALGVTSHLGFSLATSFCIGGCVWSTQALLGDRIEQKLGYRWRNALSTVIGVVAALAILATSGWLIDAPFPSLSGGTIMLAIFFGVVGTAVFSNLAKVHVMEQALKQEKIERLDADRRLTEARLKTLQAQIEPHFLFNTLSNAVSLIRSDPAAAEETLQQLTTLLRNSLSRTRNEQTNLGEEIDVLSAYLRIQQLRMGERISFSVNCPVELRATSLPPLLIQPLVENAVQHGLEPSETGGELCVAVRATDDTLEIEVRDTGLGLDPTRPAGTGLNNVRARLQSLYAAQASLRLSPNSPSGVIATVTLPR